MAVLELNFKILMCHNNKIENTFNINSELHHPFFLLFCGWCFFLRRNLENKNTHCNKL